MQAAPEKQEPLAVMLGCEIGRNVDNALTLALIYGLSTLPEPEAQFLAVSLTRSNLQGAAYCDAVGRFYSSVALREFPERFRRYRGFSVGLEEADQPKDSKALAAALDRKDDEGEPLYPHEVHEIVDTADPVALIRNALTAKADDSCAVVLAGSATSLAALLDLNGAREMLAAKVRLLVVAMDQEQAQADLPAARKLFAEWPTPVVAVESTDIQFPADAAFDWTEKHPVADVLRAAGEPAGTLGMAAALHAIRPEAPGLERSEPGAVVVGDDGRLRLEPDSAGRQHMLSAEGDELAALYREIVTAEPAPREPPSFIKRILEREKKKAEEAAEKQEEAPTP